MTSLPIANLQVKYEFLIPSLKRKVFVRPYTVKEEKLLLISHGDAETPDVNNIMQTIKDLVKDCILDKTIDVDKLPAFDIEYLFIKMRSKSVGESVKLDLKCSNDKCDTVNEHVVDLNAIELSANVDKLSKTISINPAPSFTETVKMVYPTVDQIINAGLGTLDPKDVANGIIMSCIESIKGEETTWLAKDMSSTDLLAFLDSLTIDQMARCAEFVEKMPQITHDINIKCKGCNTPIDIKLQGITDFF